MYKLFNFNKQQVELMQKNNNFYWSEQEDLFIAGTAATQLESQPDADWKLIAQELRDTLGSTRTPKQCRQRWRNHLKGEEGASAKWGQPDVNKLFDLHVVHGNKWALIALEFEGRSNKDVKSIFYSTLRKCVRSINSHISCHKQEHFYHKMKPFNENCICKIVAQEQGKMRSLKIIKGDTYQLARNLKTELLRIYRGQCPEESIRDVVAQLASFNKNCRKIKRKKKADEFSAEEEEDDFEDLQRLQVVEDPDWKPQVGFCEANLDVLEPIRSIMEDQKEKSEDTMRQDEVSEEKIAPEEKEMVSEDNAQSNHKQNLLNRMRETSFEPIFDGQISDQLMPFDLILSMPPMFGKDDRSTSDDEMVEESEEMKMIDDYPEDILRQFYSDSFN